MYTYRRQEPAIFLRLVLQFHISLSPLMYHYLIFRRQYSIAPHNGNHNWVLHLRLGISYAMFRQTPFEDVDSNCQNMGILHNFRETFGKISRWCSVTCYTSTMSTVMRGLTFIPSFVVNLVLLCLVLGILFIWIWIIINCKKLGIDFFFAYMFWSLRVNLNPTCIMYGLIFIILWRKCSTANSAVCYI